MYFVSKIIKYFSYNVSYKLFTSKLKNLKNVSIMRTIFLCIFEIEIWMKLTIFIMNNYVSYFIII